MREIRLLYASNPVDASDALRKTDLDTHKTTTPLDHPDLSVTRAKLEYPTVDVNKYYLAAVEKIRLIYTANAIYACLVTLDNFADKAVEALMHDTAGVPSLVGRATASNNFYYAVLYAANATADHVLYKLVAGTGTVLASEAIDITGWHKVKLQCVGSTISSKRETVTYRLLTPA